MLRVSDNLDAVAPLVTILVILIPLIEVVVLFLVADAISWPIALALFILIPVIGLLVLRQQGLASLRRMQASLRQDTLPPEDVVDTMLIGLAGVLLVIPGFVTAFFGILLLIPPLRKLAARGVAVWARRRISAGTATVTVTETVDAGWATVIEAEALPPATGNEAIDAEAVVPAPPETMNADQVDAGEAATGEATSEPEAPVSDQGAWESFDEGRDWEEAPQRFSRFRRRRGREQ